MATFRKVYGKWQARINWYENGKRRYKSKNGFATKALARAWAAENEVNLSDGIDIKKETTLISYYDYWVKTYKEPRVSSVTLNRYRFTRKPLVSFFKDIPIKKITRSQYQNFINSFGSNHAPHTVKEVNNIVKACVRSAILDDYLTKNFTNGVVLTANKNREVKVDYLNMTEIKRLIHKTVAGIDPKSTYTSRYMILTAIYTGMRLSEIQALTWNDIDFHNKTIDINKSWNANDHTFKPTKNKSSVRTIGANNLLLKLLSQLKERHVSNMVFMTQFGTIPTSNAVNKTLRGLLDELHIHRQNFHFHSLRHSHVALLLAHGVDVYAISKRLGHSDIRTTTNTYAYLLDEYKQETDNKIIKVLDEIV